MTGARISRALRLGAAVGAVLVLAVAAGFLLRAPSDAPLRPTTAEASASPASSIDAGPAAAMRMVDRLQLFGTGNAGVRIELDAAELTALLRHAIPGVLPAGVTEPSVQLVGSAVWVRARVSPAALPGGTHLAGVLSVVPEDVDVELRGHLFRPTSGTVAYRIERAEVEGIALPPGIVGRLVRSWPGGVAATPRGELTPSIRVRWPIRGGRFHVANGMLIIERPEPMLLQSVDGSGGA